MTEPTQPARSALIRPLRDEAEARVCARFMADSEPWLTLRRGFAHCLELRLDDSREIFAAEVDGVVTGLIVIKMQGPFAGYLQAVAVAPDWRGRGIGAQLVKFAEERIFRDSPNVFLCVSGFNPRAQAFYARLGYQRVGELSNYVIAGESEILLRKTIAPKSEFQPRRV